MDSRIVTGLIPESTTLPALQDELYRYGAMKSFYKGLNLFVATYEDSRDVDDARRDLSSVYIPLKEFYEELDPSDEIKRFAYMSDEEVIDAMERFGRILKIDSSNSKIIVSYEDRRDAKDASLQYGIKLNGNKVYLPPF